MAKWAVMLLQHSIGWKLMFDDSELVHLMNSFKGNFLKLFTQDHCMLHQLILLLEHLPEVFGDE